MQILEYVENAINEIQMIERHLSEEQLEKAVSVLNGKKRIFFSGMGRSGNMVKALAIRFMHLGFEAYVAGEASTPSIQEGDALVAVSSSGKTKITMNHIETARQKNANVILISSCLESPVDVDSYICIPAKTIVESRQHAGSLFEQSVLVVGDSICSYLQNINNISTEYMNSRHANLQ